jgi:hypothetical protein
MQFSKTTPNGVLEYPSAVHTISPECVDERSFPQCLAHGEPGATIKACVNGTNKAVTPAILEIELHILPFPGKC